MVVFQSAITTRRDCLGAERMDRGRRCGRKHLTFDCSRDYEPRTEVVVPSSIYVAAAAQSGALGSESHSEHAQRYVGWLGS
jgi:hypothetical protein